MIQPGRFYRRFKCTQVNLDQNTGQIALCQKTINLGDIAAFSSCEGFGFSGEENCVEIEYNIPLRPIIIQVHYQEFSALFEEFLKSSGMLDDRSVKKKLNYSGPVRIHFATEHDYISCVAYPENFIFEGKTPEMVLDGMVGSLITPMS